MSEVTAENTTEAKTGACQLDSLYAFKMGMTTYYDDNGESISATVLKYEPLVVSQLKTKEKDGYTAVQVAFKPKSDKRTLKSEKNHLKAAGFENGAYHVREIRQEIPAGVEVGTKVEMSSLKIGDMLKVTGTSKGCGFAGVVKRWGNAGGPETHGSGFHRRPGSIGNRTWPGRVMPGKHFPGHLGDETVTVKGIQVVDLIPEESVIIVRGSIPGAQNSLVKLMKV
jgi:large subunit ribosomal protein L3